MSTLLSRYDLTCPVCQHRQTAAPSLAMQCGVNGGHGRCLNCKSWLILNLAPDMENPTHMEAEVYPQTCTELETVT